MTISNHRTHSNHHEVQSPMNETSVIETPTPTIQVPVAFFDLDLTLLSVNSASLWIKSEYKLGFVSTWQVIKASYWLTRYHLGASSLESALLSAIKSLKGQDADAFKKRMLLFFESKLKHLLRPGALEQVAKHKAQGHLCYLCTNATNILSELFVNELKLNGMICNTFEVKQGHFTGEPASLLCFGSGKLVLAKQLLQNSHISLSECYFYTDSYSDLPLLEQVGYPILVHPDPRLEREAQKRGWPIVNWD